MVSPDLPESQATLNTLGGPPSASPGGVNPIVPGASSGPSRYRIMRPHARGGLGEVFVAHDEELHREVALKEIQAQHAGNSDSRARFLFEAEVNGRLEHPSIVPVYGLGTYPDGRPYYAMRFIQGETFKDAIDRFHQAESGARDPGRRTLELRQLLRRFLDVCNAVAYAHSQGVLHRDLKPANVMLGPFGETLVVDWGLAKQCGTKSAQHGAQEPSSSALDAPRSALDATQAGTVMGTPAFMSPEQAAGELDRLTAASDVFSLGAMLATLLTGQSPLQGKDALDTLENARRGQWQSPRERHPQTPAPLDAICRKAMAQKTGGALHDSTRPGGRPGTLAGRRAGGSVSRAALGPTAALGPPASHAGDRSGGGSARGHAGPVREHGSAVGCQSP